MHSVLHTYRKAIKSSHILGIGNGFTDGIIYFLFAVVFRFGTFLITLEEDHVLHREFDDIYTLVTEILQYLITLMLLVLQSIFCTSLWNPVSITGGHYSS